MAVGLKVRFLVVSDEGGPGEYLRGEFLPCAAARTCAVTTASLVQVRQRGVPPGGPFDLVLLAAGPGTGPSDAVALKRLLPAARLIVVTAEDDEDARRAFVSAGASAVMNRAAAARSAFHGLRPCTLWRAKQTAALRRHRARIHALRRAESERRSFLDGLFHDLRSPLTVVNASVRLLLEAEERGGPDDRLALAKMAARNCDHLLKRVVALLDISKVESGFAHPDPEALDLEGMARQAGEDARAGGAREVRVSVRAAAGLPKAWADAAMIEHVFQNLLDNAVRFARSRVFVAIRPHPETGCLRVSVVDDGPGLDPGRSAHLFERFAQAGRAPGPGYKGTGLGLSICRDLVTLNGGRIWAGKRQCPGGRFHFTLPAARVPAEAGVGRETLER